MLREPWRADVLGKTVLRCGREVVNSFRDRMLMTLVAMIALQPELTVPRQRILENLWPDEDPAVTSNRLRVLVHRLRGVLEPLGVETGTILISRRHEIALNRSGFSSDVTDFLSALDAAQRIPEPAERFPLMERAADLYTGELLPSLYHEWVLAERNRLAALHFQAIRRLTHDSIAIGEPERGIPYARQAAALESMDEEAHFDLIRILGSAGRTTEALRCYDQWRFMLHDELGAVPAIPTRNLALLLQQRVGHTAGTSSSPPTNGVAGPDEGAMRLARGETTERTAARRVLLPARLTRFFGRDEEVATLRSLLSPGVPTRLVTLLGPAGAGKTRLSIEAAERLYEDYEGRVFFAGLADILSPAQIPNALLHALRLSPSPAAEPLSQVLAAMGETPLLLVMDNMEQLLPDAKDLVAERFDRLPHCTSW